MPPTSVKSLSENHPFVQEAGVLWHYSWDQRQFAVNPFNPSGHTLMSPTSADPDPDEPARNEPAHQDLHCLLELQYI